MLASELVKIIVELITERGDHKIVTTSDIVIVDPDTGECTKLRDSVDEVVFDAIEGIYFIK